MKTVALKRLTPNGWRLAGSAVAITAAAARTHFFIFKLHPLARMGLAHLQHTRCQHL